MTIAIKERPSARRKPVAGGKAFRQPQILELPDLSLEHQLLHAEPFRHLGGGVPVPFGDQGKNGAGPGLRAVEPRKLPFEGSGFGRIERIVFAQFFPRILARDMKGDAVQRTLRPKVAPSAAREA